MSCSNCYNGCPEIVSDKCVKYTGVNVPILGIQTGDSLSYVEQALIEFLTSTLDGTGIKPVIDPTIICNLVQKYLPTCGDLTIVDISVALIKAACDLQDQVDAIVSELAILNANYNVSCLSGVVSSSDTHDVLQATINKLCSVSSALTALALDVSTNYVKKSELNALIQAYLNSIGTSTLIKNKMVPYVAVPYFGTLAQFDGTGAGTGDWVNIYLCNGQNSTPDLRGRVVVGTTTMGSTPFSPVVDPAIAGNPTYALNTALGANQITLLSTQMPTHSHTVTSVATSTDHTHFTAKAGTQVGLSSTTPIDTAATYGGNTSYNLSGVTGTADLGLTNPAHSDVTVANTVSSAGSGLPHPNIQPVWASHYIIYIP